MQARSSRRVHGQAVILGVKLARVDRKACVAVSLLVRAEQAADWSRVTSSRQLRVGLLSSWEMGDPRGVSVRSLKSQEPAVAASSLRLSSGIWLLKEAHALPGFVPARPQGGTGASRCPLPSSRSCQSP